MCCRKLEAKFVMVVRTAAELRTSREVVLRISFTNLKMVITSSGGETNMYKLRASNNCISFKTFWSCWGIGVAPVAHIV